MRRGLAPYAVIAAALLAALLLIVLGTAPPSQNDDPSSRAAGRAGTLALYDWLGTLGFQVHRIAGQFDTAGSDVLLIIDPRVTISAAEADAVMGALARGSDVVLAVPATDPGPSGPLLARLGVSLDLARPAGTSAPVQPFDAGDRVHRVPMSAGVSIEAGPSLTPLLAQGGAITAVAEQEPGGGRAVVLASPFPLSNDGLRDGDSATLVLGILERARGGAIGFDEYHHGEIASTPDGAAAIFESPLGLALLLGTATVIAYLALSGRRLGRPLATHEVALVPTTASYIDALASLYERSRDRGAVAARYADELKRRLSTPAGVDAQLGDADYVASLERVRPDLAPDAARLLARGRSLAASRPGAAELLALARDVDDLERLR